MNQFRLDGRTALVTGASRGIGAAIARALDEAGARVALVARNRPELEVVAAGLAHDPVVLEGDLSYAETPGELAAAAEAALGGAVDVLVNNAAIAHRSPTVGIRPWMMDAMYAVNVRAPLLLIAALVGGMVDRGRGSIVNLSSVSGLLGTPNRASYAATKGAIDAATRSLAMEFGPKGIRVNSVAPGVVDTALWARSKQIPGVAERIGAQIPLRRWAVPEDVADVVVFLASDASRFITGETICADGGMAHTLDLYGGPI